MSSTHAAEGLLLLHHGAPRQAEEIPAFLASVAGGRALPEAAVAEYRRRYRLCGGSPLPVEVERTVAALQASLQTQTGRCTVTAGALHGEPTISAALRALAERGVQRAAAVVLLPQYSASTVGRYLSRLDEAVQACAWSGEMTRVSSWATEPLLVAAFVEQIGLALADLPAEETARTAVVFTAHSVPLSALRAGDPFLAELMATADAVARGAGLARWTMAFQSAGRAPGSWLGPSVGEVVEELAAAGERRVLVVPIHFLFDNVETLYDLDVALRQQAERLGLQLCRARAPNSSKLLVAAIAEVARRALA